jgi:hypothetical protein
MSRGEKFSHPVSKEGFLAYPFSDHAPIQAIFEAGGAMKISMVTYNMMNRCVAESENGAGKFHSNNPLNIEESDKDYDLRLNKQKSFLILLLRGKKDFILLQECEGLMIGKKVDAGFIKILEENGYGVVCAQEAAGYVSCNAQQMIIYNKDRFDLEKAEMPFISEEVQSGDRIMFADFTHKESTQKVTIGNVHMKYGTTLSTIPKIEEYQAQKTRLGSTVVITAGDWNHPSDEVHTALAQRDATCYDSQKETGERMTRQASFSALHGHGELGKKNKSYDFFIAKSPETLKAGLQGNCGFRAVKKGDVEIYRSQPLKAKLEPHIKFWIHQPQTKPAPLNSKMVSEVNLLLQLQQIGF